MNSGKLRNLREVKQYTPSFISVDYSIFLKLLEYYNHSEETIVNNPEILLTLPIPEHIEKDIKRTLVRSKLENKILVVRSSSYQEDRVEKSHAGQFQTIIGINSFSNLTTSILMCWYHYFESLHKKNRYLNRSIIGIDLIIQEMVEAKYSGVSFINKKTAYCLSEFIIGQGELLVSGDVTPIRCECNNLKYPNQFDLEYSNQQSLVLARLSDLENRLIGEEVIWQDEKGILLGKDLFNVNGYLTFKQFKINVNMEKIHCLLRELLNTYDYDLDIEWAIDHQNTVYILQVRPQTREVLVTNIPKIRGKNIAEFEIFGESVSKGVSTGELIYVNDSTTYQAVENKILYCESFDPKYTHLLAISKGLITMFGGYLSHGAIVSREMYKPSIQNLSIADFKKLRSGLSVTLDANHSTIYINNSADFDESSSKALSSEINSSLFLNGMYKKWFDISYIEYFSTNKSKDNYNKSWSDIYDFNNYTNL
ncbi:PEP/pyruvate-binding domain-containing protein [Enterococcus gallinarum]|uniref:PEP/pyruvate-binding domain-containing protein n=1 Tax=Enterococcus gallinarum TaxID=1353 RepID=UPI001F59F0DB|nr:PEP/pyruvate-binding domain-containing protein [Enterococcus gallinarum]